MNNEQNNRKSNCNGKNPSTMEEFYFWTKPELILNPFDVVKLNTLITVLLLVLLKKYLTLQILLIFFPTIFPTILEMLILRHLRTE